MSRAHRAMHRRWAACNDQAREEANRPDTYESIVGSVAMHLAWLKAEQREANAAARAEQQDELDRGRWEAEQERQAEIDRCYR